MDKIHNRTDPTETNNALTVIERQKRRGAENEAKRFKRLLLHVKPFQDVIYCRQRSHN